MQSIDTLLDLPSLLVELCQTARRAGVAVMEIYAEDFMVECKSDNSPVTAADVASEEIILADLKRLCPSVSIISEESEVHASSSASTSSEKMFFLVDPLDGTKEFVARNGDFTVNIALICEGKPVLGVVYAPALGRLYAGVVGHGACFYQDDGIAHPIHVRRPPPSGLTVLASRSHAMLEREQAFLKDFSVTKIRRIGSSVKFCMLAEGMADLYPRFSPTMEWDTAAGHAVLKAAGGRVVMADGRELDYGKTDLLTPEFVAWGAYK